MIQKMLSVCLFAVALVALFAPIGSVAIESGEDSTYSPMYMYRYNQNVEEIGLSLQSNAKEGWSDESIDVANLKVNTADLSSSEGGVQPMFTVATSECKGTLASCTFATSCCETVCFCDE
jgi:hypothetical protein